MSTISITNNFPAFSTNDTDCTITYTLTLSNNNPINNALITFTPSAPRMNTYTTDTALEGLYNLKLKGTITG